MFALCVLTLILLKSYKCSHKYENVWFLNFIYYNKWFYFSFKRHIWIQETIAMDYTFEYLYLTKVLSSKVRYANSNWQLAAYNLTCVSKHAITYRISSISHVIPYIDLFKLSSNWFEWMIEWMILTTKWPHIPFPKRINICVGIVFWDWGMLCVCFLCNFSIHIWRNFCLIISFEKTY